MCDECFRKFDTKKESLYKHEFVCFLGLKPEKQELCQESEASIFTS